MKYILLKFKTLQNANLNQSIWKKLQYRFQTTETNIAASDTNSFELEWKNARPYKEIPTQNTFAELRNFLPGGKYYKLAPSELILALKRDVGNITRFKGYFGRNDAVMTHNADDFVTVFRNEGIWPVRPALDSLRYHRTVHRKDFFQGVEGIIATKEKKWATFRSAVNPILLQPKNVRLYVDKMSEVTKEFLERIRQIRDPRNFEVPANFADELNYWTLESISVVALDKKLGLINKNREDPLAKELVQVMNDFFKYGTEVEFQLPIWKFYKTKSFKSLMKSLDSIMFITSAYVAEAIKRLEQQSHNGVTENGRNDKSVFEKLIKIDKKIATVMAMDMLMGGVDTTSSAFTGLLLCLAKNPDKQAKLREEIKEVLTQKTSQLTEESVQNMPYLKACIKESLRVYPVVNGNSRVLFQDVVLSGYRVPKGTNVSMMFTALLYDENYFPRPMEYLPERWLRTDTLNTAENHNLKPTSPFVYLPFGFGPRSCVGRRIVEMEMKIAIAHIVRNFQVDFNYSTENAFKSVMINVPNIPLKFKFTDLDN